MNTSRREFIKQSSAGLLSTLASPSLHSHPGEGIELDATLSPGRFSVSFGEETILRNAVAALETSEERITTSDGRLSRRVQPGTAPSVITFHDNRGMIGLSLHHSIEDDNRCLLLNLTVVNLSPEALTLKSISPLLLSAAAGGTFRFWDSPEHIRILTDSWERCYGEAGIRHFAAEERIRSAWDIHVIDVEQARTMSIGFASQPSGKLSFETTLREDGGADLTCVCDTSAGVEGVVLEPGMSFSTGEIMIRVSEGSVFNALEGYATFVAKRNGIAVSPTVPVGWVDWYFAKATTTEDDILRNLDFIATELKEFGLTYVQLDSGWQLGVETEPPPHNVIAGGPWVPNSKFPRGMRWYAERIKERGLRPGIWVRPFQMIRSAPERSAHPEWFNDRGQMDFSNPDVQAKARELVHMLTQEWGYEYIKYDFPSFDLFNAWGRDLFDNHAAREHLHDPSVTNIEAYRAALSAIRRAAPTTPLLACNSVMAPTLGLADVFRIGDDVGDWERTFRYGVKSVSARYYTNGIYWANDPDVLLVREPFSMEQARMWATLIALSGGVVFISERLHELPPERLDILKKSMPVYRRNTTGYAYGRPIDFLEKDVPEVWCLEVVKPFGRWLILGLFNWSDQAIVKTLDMSPIGSGTEHVGYDFWGDEYLGIVSGTLTSTIPPLSCRLYALHEHRDHPQFLSSSRHITQGGVELRELEWRGETNVLAGTVSIVRNNPEIITIAVPPSFSPVSSNGGELLPSNDRAISRLKITSSTTEERRWSVSFRRV